SLMPTGKVLMWDHQTIGYPNPVVFDPLTGTTSDVPLGESLSIFCSGHALLPDGRVFVAGGHISNDNRTNTARIFDPQSNSCSKTRNMAYARWYPTVTKLADCRMLVLVGEINCYGCRALTPEVYDPVNNIWSQLTNADHDWPWYPHSIVL